MKGLWRVKSAVRSAITRHRRSGLMTAVHGAASFFESAWHNENADFATSGEKFVLKRLEAADCRVALDIGANAGDWTHEVLGLWPRCHVHAFEVAPHTYRRLESAIDPSHRSRSTLHNIGLSDQSGTQTMYYFPDNDKLTCESPRHAGFQSVPFEGRFSTLDEFSAAHGIDHVDFLKVDVEGAEYRVLAGAAELLRSGRVAAIQFEYGAFSIDTRIMLKDYYELLGDRYAIGKIFPDHVAFADYDWKFEDFRFSNYLCVSNDRPELRSLLQPRA